MPRLQSFDVSIRTGAAGRPDAPKYVINGFELDFDESTGGCGAGETFDATGAPDSFPHSLVLRGPASGTWRIEGMSITYHYVGEVPYTLRFGPLEIDSESDVNLQHARPLPTFSV